MPLVQITLPEGYTAEHLRTVIHRVTDAVMSSIATPSASVRVIVHETPPNTADFIPFIDISLITGRSREQLRTLIGGVRDAVTSAISAGDDIRVMLHEVPPQLWAAGNVTIAEREANAARTK